MKKNVIIDGIFDDFMGTGCCKLLYMHKYKNEK